jgi:hypothetical protein
VVLPISDYSKLKSRLFVSDSSNQFSDENGRAVNYCWITPCPNDGHSVPSPQGDTRPMRGCLALSGLAWELHWTRHFRF